MDNTSCGDAAAIAREASVNSQFKVLVSILGTVVVFWLAASAFFLLHFLGPLPPRHNATEIPEQHGIELRDMRPRFRRIWPARR
jgi:hypothetical protein